MQRLRGSHGFPHGLRRIPTPIYTGQWPKRLMNGYVVSKTIDGLAPQRTDHWFSV